MTMQTILGVPGLALTEYAIAANAILGIRDSGKTYTATKASEELFDAGVPFIWLDPIGVAHNMRIPGTGKDARGYPVVVAGGKFADLPLTTKNVGAIVRAAMQANISLVLDLFSIDLTKADWRRIVKETCEILLHENASHGLRHVFIEEAAEFVPQKVMDGQTFAAVEKLVRMGGNSKVGITLINQRSADLNKSVLELCANVFVHRQRGKNTLLDLSKWLSMTDPDTEKKITASLPDLDSGQCWIMSNDLKKPVLIKVPQKNSLHPDRRAAPISTMDLKKHQPVPADAFVAKMKAALAPKAPPVPKAVHATAAAPEAEFVSQRSQERALAAAREQGAEAVRASIPALLDAQHAASYELGYRHAAIGATDMLQGMAKAMTLPPRQPDREVQRLFRAKLPQGLGAPGPLTSRPAAPDAAAPRPAPFAVEARAASMAASLGQGGNGSLSNPERHLLRALAWWAAMGHDRPTRAQLAAIAGWKVGGSNLRGRLAELSAAGLISYPDTRSVALTATGTAAAPSPDTATTLLDSIRAMLSNPQRLLFEQMIPGQIHSREEVAGRLRWEVTGSNLRGRLAELSALELIEYPSRSEVKLQEWVK